MGLYIFGGKPIIIYINQKSIILFVTTWHKKIMVTMYFENELLVYPNPI